MSSNARLCGNTLGKHPRFGILATHLSPFYGQYFEFFRTTARLTSIVKYSVSIRVKIT